MGGGSIAVLWRAQVRWFIVGKKQKSERRQWPHPPSALSTC